MGNLYAIDRRAPSADELMIALRMRGQAVLEVTPGTPLARVALDICSLAQAHPGMNGQIRTLYLMAHGDAGLLRFGEGLKVANAIDLSPVWNCLHGSVISSIRIYGCNVGSAYASDAYGGGSVQSGWHGDNNRADVMAGRGYALLRELAHHAGVAVTAAAIRQHLGYWNVDRLLAGREYQGDVLTVTPWGSFRITRVDSAGNVTVRDSAFDFT
jgi:hypothetical protein